MGEEKSFSQRAFSIYTDIRKLQDKAKTSYTLMNSFMMGIDSEGMLISAVPEEDGHEGLNLLMVDDRIPAGAKLY